MKKSRRRAALSVMVLTIVLSGAFSGCNPWENLQRITDGGHSTRLSQENPEKENASGPAAQGAEQIFETEHPMEVERVSTARYVYTTLDGETQRVYDEIYQTIQRQEESVRVSTLSVEVLDEAYKAVAADYGELFWVSGYAYTQYSRDEVLVGLDFTPNYTLTEELRQELQGQIEEKVTVVLSGIPEEASDYEKAKYVFEYLAGNVDYVVGAPDNQNIISVFLNGQTVCQGYACATGYLLNRLGIQAVVVTGTANGSSHAWNLVRLDGEYYYIDTTWGNSTYASDLTGEERFINYNYFGVTTEAISWTHTANDYFVLPECTASMDNYYVREGRYFTEWNPDAVGALCREGYEQGNTAVSVKFSGEELLAQAKQYFIADQHISDYCPGIDSLYYVEDEVQQVLIFRFL